MLNIQSGIAKNHCLDSQTPDTFFGFFWYDLFDLKLLTFVHESVNKILLSLFTIVLKP